MCSGSPPVLNYGPQSFCGNCSLRPLNGNIERSIASHGSCASRLMFWGLVSWVVGLRSFSILHSSRRLSFGTSKAKDEWNNSKEFEN